MIQALLILIVLAVIFNNIAAIAAGILYCIFYLVFAAGFLIVVSFLLVIGWGTYAWVKEGEGIIIKGLRASLSIALLCFMFGPLAFGYMPEGWLCFGVGLLCWCPCLGALESEKQAKQGKPTLANQSAPQSYVPVSTSSNQRTLQRTPQPQPGVAIPHKASVKTQNLSPSLPGTHATSPTISSANVLISGGQSQLPTGPSFIVCADALPAGSTLKHNRYEIKAVLGQGGFGITYLAFDRQLNRRVAVKELFLQGSCSRMGRNVICGNSVNAAAFQNAKAKFLHEHKSLTQFRSATIVQIFECFEESDTAYMVMEFLKGHTLSKMVEVSGALAESEAIRIVRGIASAVNLIHKQGLLHRDIHPHNVIVCEDGNVKLIDFGLTKRIEDTIGSATRRLTHTVSFGTPGYAPLEQYGRRGQLGAYTDIYALGATLYFLLTAEEPLAATDRAVNDDLKAPHFLNQRIKVTTSEAVMRAMQVSPSQRPQSISGFLQLLDPRSQVQATHQQGIAPNIHSTTPISPTPASNGAIRQEAIRRVIFHYNGLISRHPQHTNKLSKSRDWQVSQCDEQIDFWIRRGFPYTEAVRKWEEGACRAANAKIA